MRLSFSAKKTIAISFLIAFLFSIVMVYAAQGFFARQSAKAQLLASSRSLVERILTDFRRDFRISTKYIASALDIEKAERYPIAVPNLMITYGAKEITIVDDDGSVLFSCGNSYDKSFNAKFDEDFRPVLKKLFADNEATSNFETVSGTNLICAGKMAHGGTTFIKYSSARLEYKFMLLLTNFAYNIPIRRTGYILIMDDHDTIISDMKGGGSFGSHASKIGFKKTGGTTSLKEEVLYEDKIHGKKSYFIAERFDGYTIVSVLPEDEAKSITKDIFILSAVAGFVSFAALFFFIVKFIEKYVASALEEAEEEIALMQPSEFEDYEDDSYQSEAGASDEEQPDSEAAEEYDIMQIAATVAKSTLSLIGAKKINFIAQIDPELNADFYGKKSEMEAIISCLTENAAHFTTDGMIALRLEKGANLKISVIDTGVGIKKEHLDSLRLDFEEIPDKHRYKSFSLARKIIKGMDGTFEIKSECAKGSAFMVSVPYNNASAQTCGERYGQIFDAARFDAKRPNLKNIPGSKLVQIL